MSTNDKGIFYIVPDDAPITEEARSLALANSVPVGQNYLINGAMDVWQRGTSLTNNTAHLADRWYVTANTSGNQCNQSRVSVAANLGAVYALRVQQTSSVTVVEYAARQMIESQNLYPLAGKTVTVSFWYRSNRTGTHGARFSAATRAVGATDVNVPFTVAVADTWSRYSLVFTTLGSVTAWSVAANDWGALLDIGFRTGGSTGFTSLSANDYFEITGVQLEQGSSATSFRRNGDSIQSELAACQRYFQTCYLQARGYGTVATVDTGASSRFTYPVTMRVSPTITQTGVSKSGSPAGYDSFFEGADASGVTYTYRHGNASGSGGLYFTVTWTANAEL